MSFIIAIDGPAASGKGTLARKLAEHFGFHHLDTGLLYRATAAKLLDLGSRFDDEKRAASVAFDLDMTNLDRNMLSAHEIGEAASKVAAMQPVRAALFDIQQKFSQKEPGAILDGRDIGTVICPEAQVKLYIQAETEERAMRRFKEAQTKGSTIQYKDVLADILKRDARDQGRKDAPLMIAEDAHLIDTTKMDIETAFQQALSTIDSVYKKSDG